MESSPVINKKNRIFPDGEAVNETKSWIIKEQLPWTDRKFDLISNPLYKNQFGKIQHREAERIQLKVFKRKRSSMGNFGRIWRAHK